MALSITFDHAQGRLSRDRLTSLILGRFLYGISSNCVIDEVTQTVFLRPYAADDAWWTTSTGNYVKLVKSSYTLTTSANWKDVTPIPGFGSYLFNQGGINEPVITTATYTKNRAFWVSFFSFGSGDGFPQFRCGWNSSGSLSGGVGLEFFTDGTVDVYKGGTRVGTYRVSASDSSRTMMNQRPAFFLIPGRGRELLVLSTIGGSFSHVFEDIDEDDSDPEITPAGHFWWEIVSGTAEVACAPMRFYSSGYVASYRSALAEPPEIGATLETYDNATCFGGAGQDYKIYGSDAFEGTVSASAHLVETDGTTAFVPDGSLIDYRLRVDLVGDNDYTPFIYGAQMSFAPALADTDDSEEFADAIDRLVEVSLDVPNDPGAATLSLEFIDPVAAESDIAKLRTIANRPVKAAIGTALMLDGMNEPPHFTMAIAENVEHASLDIRTRWKQLENYMFREPFSFRGFTIDAAVVAILVLTGFDTSARRVTSSSFVMGTGAGASSDDEILEAAIGDTAASWLRRIHDDYCANWFMDFVPTAGGIEFWLVDPADIDADDVAITLYPDRASAISAGVSSADAWKRIYRAYRSCRLEPEANEVRVTGYDPRLRREIQSYKRDSAAINPTTAPSLRPDNWLGEPRRYGLLDEAVTSQTIADSSASLLYDRLTPAPLHGEWEAEFSLDADDVPVWRGRLVRLVGIGTFRIESLTCRYEKEPDGLDTWQWREAHYTGEFRIEEP